METITLEARERKEITKSSRNKLRREGRTPGIFYSKRIKPVSIDVSERALQPLVFTSKTHLISLKIENQEERECIIKDIQFDPVTDRVIHFDLIGLTKGEKIQLEVPVQLIGSAVGVKEGGVLQHVLHRLQIECLPRHIPEHLTIEITELKLGDSVHVSDLNFENITILNTPESLVVSVAHPKLKEEAAPVGEAVPAAEERAEPEVIAKGKVEEKEEE
jgi:large subunit ribosomal protein L25